MKRLPRSKLCIVRRVVGASMAPTLLSGKLVVAIYPFRLRPGDVVIFRHEGREKIKRIAQLESGRLFMVGDNPTGSTDSREFGWVERNTVIGKVVWRL